VGEDEERHEARKGSGAPPDFISGGLSNRIYIHNFETARELSHYVGREKGSSISALAKSSFRYVALEGDWALIGLRPERRRILKPKEQKGSWGGAERVKCSKTEQFFPHYKGSQLSRKVDINKSIIKLINID
jgi:hypothetical protein